MESLFLVKKKGLHMLINLSSSLHILFVRLICPTKYPSTSALIPPSPYRLPRCVWGGSHLLYKDTYTRYSGHGRDKLFSALLNVIGSYIFHFNIIIVRGCLSYDTTSCQSNKRIMVDVIETYTICVFVLVSLSSFCSQFLI